MNIEYVFAKGSTAIAAVLTATGAGVGVALAETVSGANPYIITGGVVGAALSGAIALSAKKWFENQISKLIDLPTKSEIFVAIDTAVDRAIAGQAEIIAHVKTLSEQVSDIRTNHLHELSVRVAEIEMRHETEDRLDKRR